MLCLYMAPMWLLMQQPFTAWLKNKRLRPWLTVKNSIDILDKSALTNRTARERERERARQRSFKCEWTPTPLMFFSFVCNWMPFQGHRIPRALSKPLNEPTEYSDEHHSVALSTRANNYYFVIFICIYLFCTHRIHSLVVHLNQIEFNHAALFECSYFDRKTFIHSWATE